MNVDRVIIVCPSLEGGGAEHVAASWARGLAAMGVSVSAVVTSSPTASPAPAVDDRNVDLRVLNSKGFLRRCVEFRRLVAGTRASAVIGVMPYWNVLVLLGTLGLRGGPAVFISEHTLHHPLRHSMRYSFRIQLMLCRLLYRRAAAVICASHPVAAEMARAYKLRANCVRVVPNPVLRPPVAAVEIRPRLERPEPLDLVFAGRLAPEKRPELLILAAVRIRERGMTPNVHYFGSGPAAADLRRMADIQGIRCQFHGWVSAWPEEAAPLNSVLVLPSIREGFGNVLIEAAAAGIPAVVSGRAIGTSDAFVPSLTAVETQGDGVEDFVTAIQQAMKLGGVNVAMWLEQFAADSVAERLLSIISMASAASANGA